MSAQEVNNRADRLGGLRRFAIAITVLNILGHTFFGFEQSWAQPMVAWLPLIASSCCLSSSMRVATAARPGSLGGGARKFVEFLLSAHITGLACAMLLYANERLRASRVRRRCGNLLESGFARSRWKRH